MKTDRPMNALSASSAFALRASSSVANSTILATNQLWSYGRGSSSPASLRLAARSYQDFRKDDVSSGYNHQSDPSTPAPLQVQLIRSKKSSSKPSRSSSSYLSRTRAQTRDRASGKRQAALQPNQSHWSQLGTGRIDRPSPITFQPDLISRPDLSPSTQTYHISLCHLTCSLMGAKPISPVDPVQANSTKKANPVHCSENSKPTSSHKLLEILVIAVVR